MFGFVYTLFFIFSFIYLFILLAVFRNRVSSYYIMLFSTILITNYGFMQLTSATSLEAAVFANQTTYLGSSFVSFFTLMCLADLCKTPIKVWVQTVFIIFGSAIFFFSSSTGVLDLYYKDVFLISSHGVTTLGKIYGPMHALFPLYLGSAVSGGYFIIIKSFFNKKNVSYKNSILLMVLMTLCFASYILEGVISVHVPLVPVAYFITETALMSLLRKIKLYDVRSYSSDFLEETKTSGFILCSSRGIFLGCDQTAKLWFEEIEKQKIDYTLEAQNSQLVDQIKKWISGETKQQSVFITKGDRIFEVKHSLLRQRKNNSIHCFYLRDDTKQQHHTKLVENYNTKLENAVNAKTAKLRKIQNDIIVSMASIVENRDNNTGGHVARSSKIVEIFVKYLRKKTNSPIVTREFAECVKKAAPLHDFGKIAVPDEILNKPGKFTAEEYAKMKEHPEKGSVLVKKILKNADDPVFAQIAVNVAHFHHEKWDGTGYPNGLAGEEIPYEARIMALADVFDALVSKRVYKESFSYDKAFEIIEESLGSHFDPELCTAFLECRKELEELYDSYND